MLCFIIQIFSKVVCEVEAFSKKRMGEILTESSPTFSFICLHTRRVQYKMDLQNDEVFFYLLIMEVTKLPHA